MPDHDAASGRSGGGGVDDFRQDTKPSLQTAIQDFEQGAPAMVGYHNDWKVHNPATIKVHIDREMSYAQNNYERDSESVRRVQRMLSDLRKSDLAKDAEIAHLEQRLAAAKKEKEGNMISMVLAEAQLSDYERSTRSHLQRMSELRQAAKEVPNGA